MAALAVFGTVQHEANNANTHGETPKPKTQEQNVGGYFKFAFPDPITLFTFGLVAIGMAQAGLFWWQLRLIREGLIDTQEAADAAREQASLARESLVASGRAWLRVELKTSGDRLVFDENGVFYPVSIRFKNIGTSPAINILAHVWIFSGIGDHPGTKLVQKCEQVRLDRNFLGIVLFPNDSIPEHFGITEYKIGARADFATVLKATSNRDNGKRASLLIGGCVAYTFPTDPKNIHQTRFLYHISYGGDDPPVIDVPLEGEHITLSRSVIEAGHYAD